MVWQVLARVPGERHTCSPVLHPIGALDAPPKARVPLCSPRRSPSSPHLTTPPFHVAQDFWNCTKSTNHAKAIWYKGLRVKLQRVIFQRMIHSGEKIDKAALSIYLDDIKELCRQLARMNTKESAMRKLHVKTTWRIVGRAAEAGFLTLDALNWDGFFSSAWCEVPQSKSSKLKYAIFMAGKD